MISFRVVGNRGLMQIDDAELTSGFRITYGDRTTHVIKVESQQLASRVLEHTLGDIPEELSVELLDPEPGSPFAEITIRPHAHEVDAVSAILAVDVNGWKEAWSIAEYVQAMFEQVTASGTRDVDAAVERHREVVRLRLILLPDPQISLRDELLHLAERIRNHSRTAAATLRSRASDRSVVTTFDFPEAVRVPCEQYLLYFVQFLKDIGVDATAELHHTAGEVLFSVTPLNEEEALEKIRQALDVYLQLPAAGDLNIASVPAGSMAVQQTYANVQFLRGQLALASAVVQAKDATIQQLQMSIDLQRQFQTGEIVPNSLRLISDPESENSEKVLGGTVAITKYKGKGFEVDLPEIMRRLRTMISGES